jgi:phospholipase/lecithinase/hemolysin
MLRRLLYALALLACAPLLVQAAGEAPSASALPAACSRIVAFGDSLSDGGFFGRLTANRYPPSPPVFESRWTNGPTWVEVMAAHSGSRLDAKDNHAQGGATTGRFNITRRCAISSASPPTSRSSACLRRSSATPQAVHQLHERLGRVAFLTTTPAGIPQVARIEPKRGDVQPPYASADGKARLATVLPADDVLAVPLR